MNPQIAARSIICILAALIYPRRAVGCLVLGHLGFRYQSVVRLRVMRASSYYMSSTLRLATRAAQRLQHQLAVITTICFLFLSGALAIPVPGTDIRPSLATRTDSDEQSTTTYAAQNSDTTDITRNAYYLTLIGVVLAALSLCLSLVTTIIAIVKFRIEMRDRMQASSQGAVGVPRNSINDESSRQARDALALPIQSEDANDTAGIELAFLPAHLRIDTSILPAPAPMPAERPSRSQRCLQSKVGSHSA
ncbi:hypothetical protein GGR54DRAFT_309455 [Hypoxylon sp. NC1633]|nr:hypothetical protein GGR54DRAFT_309455 [Hypoxylon sp. NC1633]